MEEVTFDVVIRGGTVYDGSGGDGRRTDVGIVGDKIAAIGDLSKAEARRTVDASGLAVAPGFINMLSWSTDSLIVDGKSQSELRQGVTTQIFGEGFSMGPLNDKLRKFLEAQQTDFKYEMPWSTLSEYLAYLEKRGISQNVASYVGATTLRTYVIGFDKRAPTAAELDTMRELVRKEMEAGALGIGSAAHLCPRQLRVDGGAHRALQGGREVQGEVHLAHAERGGRAPGGRGRAHPDRPRSGPAGGDLPSEGGRQGELAQDGPGHREGRRRAARGPRDPRQHVHVYRGRNLRWTRAWRRGRTTAETKSCSSASRIRTRGPGSPPR